MGQLIVIIDENNNAIGAEDKHIVHLNGILHRAFSLFVMNSKNQIMLQQRAFEKYHSGGLWTNTCCSHALPNEPLDITIHKRTLDEMGFDCEIQYLFNFKYKIGLDNNMIENELDNVYIGFYEGSPAPDPTEVCNWKWADIDFVSSDIKQNPQQYTYWFKFAFARFYEIYNEQFRK